MKNLLIKIRCEKRIEPSSDLVKLSLPDYKNGLTIPPKVSWAPFVKLCFMLGTFGYSYYLLFIQVNQKLPSNIVQRI